MKILSFGSINIDYVYHVDEFVKKGETLPCKKLERYLGGKGANQSIAISIAGARNVFHAGKIGAVDSWLADEIARYDVDTSLIKQEDGPSGHAIIQMDSSGDNSIITFGGANRMITQADIEQAFSGFAEGDFLLIQNELNCTASLIEEGHRRGLRIFINASPIDKKISGYRLDYIDYVIANEVEAEMLTNGSIADDVLKSMRVKFPNASIVVTLGSEGAICLDRSNKEYKIPAPKVTAVATTSAGDTFAGYFVASIAENKAIDETLKLACKAAALCVTRPGTTNSIPRLDEVDAWTP